MSKHTPRPWKAHFEEAYFVTGPDLGRVAMMMNLKGAHGLGGRRTGAESAANCLLIAAAPDLLDALQSVIDFPADFFDRPDSEAVTITLTGWHLKKARSAIVKATGGKV